MQLPHFIAEGRTLIPCVGLLICDVIAVSQRYTKRRKKVWDIRKAIAEENRRDFPAWVKTVGVVEAQGRFPKNSKVNGSEFDFYVPDDFSCITCTCDAWKFLNSKTFYNIKWHEPHCKKRQFLTRDERVMDFFASGLIDPEMVDEIVSKGV